LTREPLLFAGTVVKPQGIRGEVRVKPETDSPSDWVAIKTVEMRLGEVSLGVRRVLSTRVMDSLVVIALEGVKDREAAESLRAVTLWVERSHVEKKGRVFLADIPGCVVSDESGIIYGNALRVEQYPGNDVLVLQSASGLIFLPMVDKVIRRINIRENRIVVDSRGVKETAVYED
jgi:16S rRNA processing protein RimM